MKNIIRFILLFLGVFETYAQSNYAIPQSLGDSINTNHDEINPVISSDGKTIYFTRIQVQNWQKEEKQTIWFSELKPNGEWSKAKPFPDNLNAGKYNSVLSISDDGKRLLLNGVFTKKNIYRKRGLSFSTRLTDSTWSNPVRMKVPGIRSRNKGLHSNAYLSNDDSLLLISCTPKFEGKRNNLYITSQNKRGKWKKLKKISKKINSRKSEEAPFLSKDKKNLYFTSHRNGKHDLDIFVSTRNGQSITKWSTPKRLSDTINSNEWDSYYKMNKNESWAYFASNRNKSNGSDIFRIKIFEENPFVIIRGYVLNKKSKERIDLKKYALKLTINETPYDSLKINYDSSSYEVKLPLGVLYKLKPDLNKYTSDSILVDVEKEKDFKIVYKDILVEVIPFVQITGKLLIQPDNVPLKGNDYDILVNGQKNDLISIDREKSSYLIKLPFGEIYKIKLECAEYDSEESNLDLSKYIDYQDIKTNLYVKEKKKIILKDTITVKIPEKNQALVTGFVYNKETGLKFKSDEPFTIHLNDIQHTAAIINHEKSSYEIVLELGKSYTINANSPNHYPSFEIIDLTKDKTNVKVYRDLHLHHIKIGAAIKLNNIFFESGKSNLKKQSFPELQRVVKFLQLNPNIHIEIQGHTDNVGLAHTNLLLSKSRAKAVKKYLNDNGVTQEQVKFEGFGSLKPISSNKTKKGQSLNRRVEFKILDIK